MEQIFKKDLPALYKVTTSKGRSPYNDFKFSLPENDKPGDWHEVNGPLIMCKHGFHCASWHQLIYRWFSDYGYHIYQVEVSGRVYTDDDADKYVCSRLRLVRRIETPSWVQSLRDIVRQIDIRRGNLSCLRHCHDTIEVRPNISNRGLYQNYHIRVVGPIEAMEQVLYLADINVYLIFTRDDNSPRKMLVILYMYAELTGKPIDKQLENVLWDLSALDTSWDTSWDIIGMDGDKLVIGTDVEHEFNKEQTK